jgi:hypothetical protein
MLKLSISITSLVLSYVFWWGADELGCAFFAAFLISGVGALFGCWLGWWLHERFLR